MKEVAFYYLMLIGHWGYRLDFDTDKDQLLKRNLPRLSSYFEKADETKFKNLVSSFKYEEAMDMIYELEAVRDEFDVVLLEHVVLHP